MVIMGVLGLLFLLTVRVIQEDFIAGNMRNPGSFIVEPSLIRSNPLSLVADLNHPQTGPVISS